MEDAYEQTVLAAVLVEIPSEESNKDCLLKVVCIIYYLKMHSEMNFLVRFL